MSIPVTVYRWDDIDAPVLDAQPNCIINIIKSCLCTGYGDKTGVGWSIEFETETQIALKANMDVPLFLRLYSDNGRSVKPVCYKSMSSVSAGEVILSCSTDFKYGAAPTNGKWVVIACSKGFWFFCETSNANGLATYHSGSYLYAGMSSLSDSNTTGNLLLAHTGGTWGITDDDRTGILDNANTGGSCPPRTYVLDTATQVNTGLYSCLTGGGDNIPFLMATPIYLYYNNMTWRVPGFVPSNMSMRNYETIIANDREYMTHGTSSGYGSPKGSLILVPIDYWEL